MHAPRLDLAAVKAQLNIVDFAARVTTIRRAGAHWRGTCPCCEGKSKEPFLVDPGTDGAAHWKCFACDESGDVFQLHQIARQGTPHIAPDEFMAVVRDAAAVAGVSLPEPPPRVRSETDRAAALVEEAWAAVVAVVRETPVAGDHPAAQWSAAIRARVAVGWFDPAIVHTHLDRLGMTADTRRRAGLSEEALRTFRPGQVYLREGARGAISFSQQQANGHWVHLLPPRAGGWKPLAFTDAGRGREEVRQVAVALSPEVAVSLAASLRDAASTEGRRYAVLLGGPRQLDVSLDTLTRRAVILVPDEISTTAAIYRTGAELTTRGTAVRVAAVGACSPAHLDESLEFAAWQYHVLRSDVGLEPGSPEAAAWVRDKVVPIAQAAPDPVVGAVLVHRAMQLAVGAALALDAPDVHGVGVTAPTPSAA